MTKKPVSYGYQKISLKKARALTDIWLNKSLPKSQWQIVAPILKEKKIPEVAIKAVKIVKNLELEKPNILDVGCSSGYYYDFFKWAGLEFDYEGCDISPHFISLARKKHRKVIFKTASILKLPYENNGFDVVLASGVLHYELDYQLALKELARVSSKYVLLHRLPVFAINAKTGISYYKKIGYGVDMMEIVFDWKTLNQLFLKLKLSLRQFLAGDKLDFKTPAYWTTILLKRN